MDTITKKKAAILATLVLLVSLLAVVAVPLGDVPAREALSKPTKSSNSIIISTKLISLTAERNWYKQKYLEKCVEYDEYQALLNDSKKDLEKIKKELDYWKEGLGLEEDKQQSMSSRGIPRTEPSSAEYQLSGEASYYGEELRGRRTASGEVFNPDKLTAAHRSLDFGTKVRVRNTETGAEAIVTINDRGPYAKDKHGRYRAIDLSAEAFRKIAPIGAGVCDVMLEVIQ